MTPAAVDRLAVTVSAVAETGIPAAFTVTAHDPYGNVATSYTGTIHFTSSDSAAALPPNSTLTGGVGVFTATLRNIGQARRSPPPTRAGTMSAVSAPIAVRGLIVSELIAHTYRFQRHLRQAIRSHHAQPLLGAG